MCMYVNFKTRPPAAIFVRLALVKDIRLVEERRVSSSLVNQTHFSRGGAYRLEIISTPLEGV